jgi:hypothetical protein
MNRAAKPTKALLFSLLAGSLAIVCGFRLGDIFTQSDAGSYLLMAQGRSADVLQPFLSRQLLPLLVRLLAHAHIGVQSAFIAIGILSIFVLLFMVGMLLETCSPRILVAVGCIPFWAILFEGLVLPDLFHGALLGIMLWLLLREKYVLAALMFFPLEVARESTLLALLIYLVVMKSSRILAAVSTIAGAITVRLLLPAVPHNREHTGMLAYMAGKTVWNFAKNILGFPLTIPSNANNCTTPRWTLSHGIGVCQFNLSLPFHTLRIALTLFGLFPLCAALVWRKTKSRFLRFCFTYGAAAFILAPILGSSLPRLFGYSWPLMLIAVPVLIEELGVSVKFLVVHLALAWSCVLQPSVQSATAELCATALIALIYFYFLREWKRRPNNSLAPTQ